jgi:hypothetical protein
MRPFHHVHNLSLSLTYLHSVSIFSHSPTHYDLTIRGGFVGLSMDLSHHAFCLQASPNAWRIVIVPTNLNIFVNKDGIHNISSKRIF